MKLAGIFLIVLCLYGCGKKESPSPPPLNASAPVLITPAANEICVPGEIVSLDKSEVTFSWNAVSGATSYELAYTDLLNNTTKFLTITGTKQILALSRDAPYEWSVTAVFGANNKAKSELRRFYNPGAATSVYAPFPAELLSPALGKSFGAYESVYLKWKGSAIDNNIKNYDIYFGANANPPLWAQEKDYTEVYVEIKPKTTYYWRIITRDNNGNTSQSPLYEFTVR